MFKVLDLFSGIGGFSLGLERTGHFKTIAFCEIDNYCQRVLHKHWPGVYIHSDIRTLTAKHFDGWERPDVIVGGFPCQDISLAGKGAGIEGERSGLWREYARLVGDLRPRYIVVENVSALLARGLGRVLGDLAAIGYDAEWECIPASAIGAPHRRDRIWIVAYPAIRKNQRRERGIMEGAEGRGERIDATTNACCEDVADSDNERLEGRNSKIMRECTGERIAGQGGSREVSDSAGRCEQCGRTQCNELGLQNEAMRGLRDSHDWKTEPNVGRVADGVPSRVDRLRSLGNSIVPQIATWIGNRIVEAEQ